MSYDAVESSAYAGQPVELYRFSAGLRKWLYTSADVAVVYLTETYEPYPLKRGSFRQTAELAKTGLEINTPRDTPFVSDMVASPLLDVVMLTIYRKHRSDAEVLPFWRGRVEGVRFQGSESFISCKPLGTALKRIGLHRPAQVQCPHALYGAGCNLTEALFAETGSLLSHTGTAVTSGVFAGHADGWWVGGKIDFSGALRFIIGHVGDTITLTGVVPGLAQNAAFIVYPGCDHTPATCDAKFGNLPNHGGAPGFPIKNPFTGDSAF